MTLGAGLVLSGCGDDDTATTPAPAPPPPPPPPAPEPEPEPEAPSTPTGFHVDTTETSLTWHWNAVEGAIGYAVQVSQDEMFDDTDTITPTAETSFTVADLPPQTTLYARVAAAAGTLEAPLLSAWTTHVTGTTNMPPPPPPPPMAPATPTGLMAEEGEGSITWMWDAVEGADGYAIQVSMDEMFDDMDETMYTAETSHTVSDLGYGETRFARVASTAGEGEEMLMSMFTTHVTGMSMAEPPPPPPPAPDPVEVTFTPPDPNDDTLDLVCDRNPGSPLCPDSSRNMATAKASVNPDMTVASNTTAVIVPVNFAEGANPVKVHEGDNMPFAFVDWEILQSTVVSDGAQFKIMRVTLGANQEMEPSGDVAYVTCGPFECTESSMEIPAAPEISVENSAICTTFEADLQFLVGVVDPMGDATGDSRDVTVDGTTTDGEPFEPGLDLGVVYTANNSFAVTHDFGSFTKAGFGGSKASRLEAIKAGTPDTTTTASPPPQVDITTDAGAAGEVTVVDIAGCEPTSNALYIGTGPSALRQPEECFRITSEPGDAFFADYSVTVTPSAGLSWSRNTWPQIPKGAAQKCAGTTFVAAEQVDVCELLEDEVALMDEGSIKAIPVVSSVVGTGAATIPSGTGTAVGATGANQVKLAGFDLELADDQTQWKHLMYYDTTTRTRNDMGNLYDDNDAAGTTGYYTANKKGRLTGEPTAAAAPITQAEEYAHRVWVPILDTKGAPMYGDLGKVDAADKEQTDTAVTSENDLLEGNADYDGPFGGDNIPDNFTIETYNGSASATACSAVDGGENGKGTKTILSDGVDAGNGAVDATGGNTATTHDIVTLRTGGSLCDAEDVEIESSVTFTDNLGLGCEVERSFTLTCDWDANGGMTAHQTRTVNLGLQSDGAASTFPSGLPTTGGNFSSASAGDFVSCTVEMN